MLPKEPGPHHPQDVSHRPQMPDSHQVQNSFSQPLDLHQAQHVSDQEQMSNPMQKANSNEPQKPNLLDEMRNVLRLKHYSIRTEEAYVQWVKRFVLFYNKKHPKYLGEDEIRKFLTHLATHGNIAASTQNQALSAILFLYKDVLNQNIEWIEGIEWSKRPRKLPVVFTKKETRAVLLQLEGTKWIMASLLYGAGLRLMECLRLRVKDVDFAYYQITIRDGKGEKDRITMLPVALKEPLTKHLEKVKV